MKFPVLKTKNYNLRSYRLSDAECATENLSNPNINRWLSSLPVPYRLRDAREWIDTILREQRKKHPSKIIWVIESKGRMIGAVGLHSIVPGHKAELGYWLSESFWGSGAMTEAVQKVSNYAFKEFKLIRIYAKVYKGNEGSKKVLLKNGFQVEGMVRKGIKKHGRVIDYNLMAKVK